MDRAREASMEPFTLAELPPALGPHVQPRARLEFPTQGKTSDVAFAAHGRHAIVIKRCAHGIYLDWLRREHVVLRALADSGLPIPRLIAYAEVATRGKAVGWLLMSRLPGTPFLSAAVEAAPPARAAMFRRLGEFVRKLHAARIPPELEQTGSWLSRQIEQARTHLPWCDGTAASLAERGDLRLIDWAGGGSGDPRHDLALALQTKPELELSREALDAFFAGYGTPALDERTRDWLVRLYDYF